MALEKTIERAIRNMLKTEFDAISLKIHGGPFMAAGLPDIIAVVPERETVYGSDPTVHHYPACIWWLEVKVPGGKLTKIQDFMIQNLKAHGANVAVVHSVDEARAALLGRT